MKRTLLTVWLKELRELGRDTNTLLLTLVLGPLLMPLFILGMGALGESRASSQSEKPLEIAITGAEHAPNLVAFLASQGVRRKTVAGDLDAAVRSQREDLYLQIEADFAENWRSGKPAQVTLVSDPTRQDAGIPTRRVQAALAAYGQQVASLRLLARGIDPSVAAPVAVAGKDLSTPEAKRGMALMFLPYLLLLSAFLGGAHLVIDATAGERERQSLEPLLATPASRGAIVSGKIAAATTLGLTTLLLTLLALKTGAALAPGMARSMSVGFAAIGKMLLVLLPMVLVSTTLLTWLAAGARTVKQAQGYISLLVMLPMVPTIVLMVNPVKTQLWQFVVPFLAQNQMLVQIIRGEADNPLQWTVYLLSAFALAALLWFAAVRRYAQERLAIST